MNDLSFISVIIPCRDEEKFIGRCLDSIIAQNYPKDRLEVLLVKGTTKDRTGEIAEKYAKQYPFIKLLDNPRKVTPVAMNIGIKNAKGDIIMKVDAHTVYEKNYISNCIRSLGEYNADNVGGTLKPIPENSTLIAKAITLSISSPFGVGNSYFRIGCKEPKWVDTAAFGCYKREVFEKIGPYNENLSRGQDMELNLRLKKAGGKVLLHPEIIGYYYPPAKFASFLKHSFTNGLWAILPFKYADVTPVSLRHLVPFIFVLSLIGSGLLAFLSSLGLSSFLLIVGLYSLCNIYFSVQIAMREKDLRLLFLMPIAFALFHLSYGLGSLYGLLKLLLSEGSFRL